MTLEPVRVHQHRNQGQDEAEEHYDNDGDQGLGLSDLLLVAIVPVESEKSILVKGSKYDKLIKSGVESLLLKKRLA